MQEGPAGRGTSARHDPLSKATERARQRPAMAAERADAASDANLVGPAAEGTRGAAGSVREAEAYRER